MKVSKENIIIGEGLGEIFFGMSRADIRKKLGDPTEIENYEYIPDTGEMAESWHYDNLDISLTFFEEDADWQLETIAVSSDQYLLEDTSFIGLTKEQAINKIIDLDLGLYEVETFEEENQTLISLTDQNMIMWLDNDVVQEIQWEPIWNED